MPIVSSSGQEIELSTHYLDGIFTNRFSDYKSPKDLRNTCICRIAGFNIPLSFCPILQKGSFDLSPHQLISRPKHVICAKGRSCSHLTQQNGKHFWKESASKDSRASYGSIPVLKTYNKDVIMVHLASFLGSQC